MLRWWSRAAAAGIALESAPLVAAHNLALDEPVVAEQPVCRIVDGTEPVSSSRVRAALGEDRQFA